MARNKIHNPEGKGFDLRQRCNLLNLCQRAVCFDQAVQRWHVHATFLAQSVHPFDCLAHIVCAFWFRNHDVGGRWYIVAVVYTALVLFAVVWFWDQWTLVL